MPLNRVTVASGSDQKLQRNPGKEDSTKAQHSTSVNVSSTVDSNLDAIESEAPELTRHFQDKDAEDARSYPQNVGVEPRTNTLQHRKVRGEKDPKSFTQNLFDTVAMRVLQIARVPNELGLSKWAAWVRGEADNVLCEESTSRCHTPSSRGSDSPGSNATWSIAEGSSEISRAATITSSESHDDQSTSPNEHVEKPRTSEGDKGPFSGSPNRDGITQDDLQGPSPLLKSESFKKDNDSPSSLIPPSRRPQTLSHFTSENISLMVSMVKEASPIAHEERQFMHSLGRTEEPIKYTAFVRGNATPQDVTVAYGIQSITNVLGSTKALLRSFRCKSSVQGSIATTPSVGFEEISVALRTLMEVDYHPSNIFPSLWYSIGNLYLPGPTRSKSPVTKTHSQTRASDYNADLQLQKKRFDSTSTDNDILSDAEAAHVTKIALAALVASVPIYCSKTWRLFQYFRATGNIAVATIGRAVKHTGVINSLLEISDSLDNELAMDLMTRLVKAIAARRCISEISRNQVSISRRDTHPLYWEKDILGLILDSVMDSNGTNSLLTPTTGTLSTGGEAIVNSPHSFRAKQTSEVTALSIIVEWLRSVVLREWDGKAKVARWSAVGGALEFLSYICRQLSKDNAHCLGVC